VAVFKGFAGNRIVDGFLLVAQWQFYREFAIVCGIGHRLLVEDDMAIVGINVFTDYETKSRHRRLSLGLEYQQPHLRLL
jgi:hypothetical protein